MKYYGSTQRNRTRYAMDAQTETMLRDISLIIGAAFVVIALILIMLQMVKDLEDFPIVRLEQVMGFFRENVANLADEDLGSIESPRRTRPCFQSLLTILNGRFMSTSRIFQVEGGYFAYATPQEDPNGTTSLEDGFDLVYMSSSDTTCVYLITFSPVPCEKCLLLQAVYHRLRFNGVALVPSYTKVNYDYPLEFKRLLGELISDKNHNRLLRGKRENK